MRSLSDCDSQGQEYLLVHWKAEYSIYCRVAAVPPMRVLVMVICMSYSQYMDSRTMLRMEIGYPLGIRLRPLLKSQMTSMSFWPANKEWFRLFGLAVSVNWGLLERGFRTSGKGWGLISGRFRADPYILNTSSVSINWGSLFQVSLE